MIRERQLSLFEDPDSPLIRSSSNPSKKVGVSLRGGGFILTGEGRDYQAKNVLGNFVSVDIVPHTGPDAWRIKYKTANCLDCQHCIGHQAALEVIARANSVSGRHHIETGKHLFGVCLWGKYPKLLTEKAKAKKCEFFGKTTEEYRKTHPGLNTL